MLKHYSNLYSNKGGIHISTVKRLPSSLEIYHVMLRGNEKKRIFKDSEDYRKFLYVLGDCQKICGFSLLAYCLMPNHIHLLIRPGPAGLSNVFERIGARFALWYNKKYDRVGHLFQDRYRSKPVNSIYSVLAVARYIHQNPVKAGICSDPYRYKYSSFKKYFSDRLIDQDLMFSMVSADYFIKFNLAPNHDSFMDIDDIPRQVYTDEQAAMMMQQISGCVDLAEFHALDKNTRNEILLIMLEAGMSMLQISRITGVSYFVIYKLKKK